MAASRMTCFIFAVGGDDEKVLLFERFAEKRSPSPFIKISGNTAKRIIQQKDEQATPFGEACSSFSVRFSMRRICFSESMVRNTRWISFSR